MKTSRLSHSLIATMLLCIAAVGYSQHMPDFDRFFSGINDFLPRYTQARMVGTNQMYSIEAGYREQDQVVGSHISGAYHDRLPWQALMMWPLGQLPYLSAYWIWIALHLAAFAALVHLWLLPFDHVIWGATFLPLSASIIVGQDTLLLTVCLAGVLRLAEKRWDFAAGLLLALCTAKPHLFLLVPLALIAQSRWRVISGALLGSCGLLIAGTVASTPDWPFRLLEIAKVLGQDTGLGVVSRPSLFQLGMTPLSITLALLLALMFGVFIWRASNLQAAVATATLGSILIAPHTAVYDLPILLVVLPALSPSPYTRWLRIALLTPLPYWALLNGAPWSAVFPLLLLAITIISAWPSRSAGVSQPEPVLTEDVGG